MAQAAVKLGFRGQASGTGQRRFKVNEKITLSQKQHDKIIELYNNRMKAAKQNQDQWVLRFREIDKELAGHHVPNKEDQKRIRDNRAGRGPKTVEESIQFALMQLDECVTFLLGVFAPANGMYRAITTSQDQGIGNSFSALMNKHARIYQHYRFMARGFLDCLKYNLGGFLINWDEQKGPKIQGSVGGAPKIVQDSMVASGNELLAVDPYNTFFDPAVLPIDCPDKGEFICMLKRVREFDVVMEETKGFYFTAGKRDDYNPGQSRYYNARPIISHQYLAGGAPVNNFDEILSTKYGHHDNDNPAAYDSNAIERGIMYVWLCPKEFGLGPYDGMQVWRLHVLDSALIARADQMTNVFNKLPFGFMMPNEDGMQLQSRTFAEVLLPFQRFASSQINIHTKAASKRLYGLTVINRRLIPALENEATRGGIISVNPAAEDYDVGKAVKQFNDAPDTTHTLEDVERSLGFMQKLLPTQQANQVASLDRATMYQAAAFVQASNKRNLKMATLIDDQGLDKCRVMQSQNILQFQSAIKFVDPTTSKTVEIKPDVFRDLEIEFAIADGLRGLDVLLLSQSLQQVINMLLQSQVARDYDIGGIINYFLQLQGDKVDFNQFKYQHPIDALPPEVKDALFAQLQQAQQGQAQQGNGPPVVNRNGPPAPGQQPQQGAAPQPPRQPQPGQMPGVH